MECDATSYYNSTDNKCYPCPVNCSTCDHNSSSPNTITCDTCDISAFHNATGGTCDPIPQCNASSHYNDFENNCFECPENCSICDFNSNTIKIECTECLSGAFPNVLQLTCDAIPICNSTCYYKSNDNLCNLCPTNCTSCIYNSSNTDNLNITCQICDIKAFDNITYGTCDPIPSCDLGSYYSDLDNICLSCPQNCSRCAENITNELNCSQCLTSYWLNSSVLRCDPKASCSLPFRM